MLISQSVDRLDRIDSTYAVPESDRLLSRRGPPARQESFRRGAAMHTPKHMPAPFTRRSFLTFIATSAMLSGSALRIPRSLAATSSAVPGVRALVFDVFGTVVDWRASIIREGQLLGERKGYDVDWGEFADRWRAGYGPSMNRVRSGELPWTKLDELHRMVLDELVEEFSLTGMTEEELQHFNYAWHRLMPWPDAIAGLSRLRNEYVIAPLSNGNVSLLLDMAKNAGLPWDTILSAEL